MSMQVGELALNELKVQCEDCCSQIFIFKPNKFAAASIAVAEQESEKQCQFDEYFTLFLFLFFKFELYYNEYIHGLAFLQRAQHFQICGYIGSQVCFHH
jgi:hypothetical protein